MDSRPFSNKSKGCEEKQTMKGHLVSSQMLLVDSLYHLGPLLDCVIAEGLLTRENCYEIEAERTPTNKARKLLEIVDAQLDESGACIFMGCLRKCQKHYPRLQLWLNSEDILDQPPSATVKRGPTECHVQANLSLLCPRLGCSVVPVSYDLFSRGILTQLELEKIEAILIPIQQAQMLLSICLKKGECACKSFYAALQDEDKQLAEELKVKDLEADPEEDAKSSSMQIPVEETRCNLASKLPLSGGLQEMMAQLGLTVGGKISINVCEVGVALGLSQRTVREHLLDGVGIEDLSQLEAIVDLYMEKTRDEDRLLSRVAELNPQRVQLSERGCLLLRLLQKAETILRSETQQRIQLPNLDHLHSWDHLYSDERTNQSSIWAIFGFLMWDTMAEVLEAPEAKSSGGILGMMELLRGSGKMNIALLQEVEQCWTERDVESLLQSVRVLAQLLRDLHPLQQRLQLSSSAEGLFSCRRNRLHRVTSFQGVSARAIRKALSPMLPACSDQDANILARQYFETCVQIARLLDVIIPHQTVDFTNAPIARVTQHVRFALSNSAFSSEAFDAGVRHRLLSVLEFNPAQLGLGSLMELHQKTLSDLQHYIRLGDHHNFQFILEFIRIIGSAKLVSVSSINGPVEIDCVVEETFRFVTSEATSFIFGLHCICYEEGPGRLKVRAPRCTSLALLSPEVVHDVLKCEAKVLAEVCGRVVLREGAGGLEELDELARRHNILLMDEGCCFKVESAGFECEVKVIYKSGRLCAVPHRHCKVL